MQEVKKNVYARPFNLPDIPEFNRSTIPLTSDVGKLLSFSGKCGSLFYLIFGCLCANQLLEIHVTLFGEENFNRVWSKYLQD